MAIDNMQVADGQFTVDFSDQRRSNRQRLEMEAKVMMLRCCMVDDDGNKVPRAEALLDFQFIMDALELQKAAAMMDVFYRKKNRSGKKTGYRMAMETLLDQHTLSFRDAFPDQPNPA